MLKMFERIKGKKPEATKEETPKFKSYGTVATSNGAGDINQNKGASNSTWNGWLRESADKSAADAQARADKGTTYKSSK